MKKHFTYFIFLLFFLLFHTDNISGQTGCEDAPCASANEGNGPIPCDSKLYCSNSDAVDNGFINCTPAADTDGCGVDASLSALPGEGSDVDLFLSMLPAECYTTGQHVQWIRFMTPIGVNQFKIQGSGQVDSWALYWVPSADWTFDPDNDPYATNAPCTPADLQFTGACTNANQYMVITNLEADVTKENLYFIALIYDSPSNGTINFKVKQCEMVDICEPSIECPEEMTFECDDQDGIDAWLHDVEVNTCGAPLLVKVNYLPFTNCDGTGSQEVTFELQDQAGNIVASCMATIHLVDTSSPYLSQPGDDVTIDCDATPEFTPPSAIDNCDPDPEVIEVSDETWPGDCPDTYIRTVCWKARDCSGNASEIVCQTITIGDTGNPTIEDPGDDATIDCEATPEFTPPSAWDSCDPDPEVIEVSDETWPDDCPGSYTRTVCWKARDCSGNTSVVVCQSITVEDNTPPSIEEPGYNEVIECGSDTEITPPSAWDNCDPEPEVIEVSDETWPGDCPGNYTRTVCWKARDCSGNTSQIVCQTFTAEDNTPPSIEEPGDNDVIECGSGTGITAPSAWDNCDPEPEVIEVSDETWPGDCPGTYTRTVCWKARDCSGNTSQIVCQTFTVEDTTPPTIEDPGDDEVLECGSNTEITPPSAWDNCDPDPEVIEVSDETWPGDCPGSYTRTVCWKARDCSGNTSQIVCQTITAEDTTPPSIEEPGDDEVIECGSGTEITPPSAWDNCDPEPEVIEVSDETWPGDCPGTYTRTVCWKARDCSGNTSQIVCQTFTVEDTTPPTIEDPGDDEVLECGSNTEITPPSAWDNCDPDPEVIEVSDETWPGDCPGSYTRTVCWKARDCSGNTSQIVCQTITAEDNTPPSIEEPDDDVIECGSGTEITPPSAWDNCDPEPEVIEVSDETWPGDCPGNYTRTVCWKARDCSGNTSQIVCQTITVEDTTPPSIEEPSDDEIIECDSDTEITPPSAWDNCDPNPVVIEVSDETWPGDCPGTYTRTVCWKARDCSGNASEIVCQTINIEDTGNPTIGDPGDDTTIDCEATPEFTPPNAWDSCDPNPELIEVSDEIWPDDCPGSYTRTVCWKARDCNGNTSGIVCQSITVEDTTPPSIGDPGNNQVIECGSGTDITPPNAWDNCDPNPEVIEVSDETWPGECPGNYTRTVCWKARDCSGNTSEIVCQTFTVEDTTPPTIEEPTEDRRIECDDMYFKPPNAWDSCDPDPEVVQVSSEFFPGDCPSTFTGTVCWRARDCSGNKSEIVCQTIIIEDTTPPSIGDPGENYSIECGIAEFTPPSAWDNCDPYPSIIEVSDETWPGDCPDSYTRTICWKARDCSGNTSEIVCQTITVEDTTGPEGTCPDLHLTVPEGCDVSCLENLDLEESIQAIRAAFSDACGEVIVTLIEDSGIIPCSLNNAGDYEFSRTYTFRVKDECGNEAEDSPCRLTFSGYCAPTTFCTLTQGGWGNAGGQYPWNDDDGKAPTMDIMTALINDPAYGNGELVIGDPVAGNSLTITDPNCVLDLLPGNGHPGPLPGPGSVEQGDDGGGDALADAADCSPYANQYHHNSGRIKNNLASNTIALQLNIWYGHAVYGSDLGALSLGDDCFPVSDALPDDVHTVQDLLDYVNLFLSGQLGDPNGLAGTLTEIITSINEYFHECTRANPCDGSQQDSPTTYEEDQPEGRGRQKLTLYPNPAKEEIRLTFEAELESTWKLILIDINGKVIQNRPLSVKKGLNEKTVNINALSAGLYWVRLFNKDEVLTKKFAKIQD